MAQSGHVGDGVTEARAQVLIVGAGPTGLVLALWLTRPGGVRVRIVDKTAEPGTTSRAVAVQARTLEFYRQIGLADAVVARAHLVSAANMWMAGGPVALPTALIERRRSKKPSPSRVFLCVSEIRQAQIAPSVPRTVP